MSVIDRLGFIILFIFVLCSAIYTISTSSTHFHVIEAYLLFNIAALLMVGDNINQQLKKLNAKEIK